MPLSIGELLAPVGPLNAALLFPGEEPAAVGDRMAAYIASANKEAAKLADATPAARDAVAYLWVVWRAYYDVVDRMANTPASFSAADEGSVTFSSEQLKAMQRRTDAALTAYNDAVAALAVDITPPTTPRSVSVRVIPTW